MSEGRQLLDLVRELYDRRTFQELNWEGTFEEYLEIVRRNPKVTRTAFQRIYDMIISHGFEVYERFGEKIVHYRFFDDPFDGEDALFGLDKPLMQLVQFFRSAAKRYGTERRILLLHGPVGGSKSTIVRLLKKGLEHYSRTPEGALYSFSWREERNGEEVWSPCPMNEEPLHLVPEEIRPKLLEELNQGRGEEEQVQIYGELCPFCRQMYREKMKLYDGDWGRLIQDVRVRRVVLSEKDRVGIGTFQPKDEKSQDSTELTGDINYRKIAEYGSDSDARAFNFDGELNIANRGLVEFVEILKLEVAFLYDLLGASQEHRIKPKKFAQTYIDEVIIGHTNAPEYQKLLSNEYMEALRDRTIKIDIPYVLRLEDEMKIYERDFNPRKVRGKHIAPHAIEVASMWAILTRLDPPKKANLSLMQKLKLYNGKTLPGFTEDNVKELMEESPQEGMKGISPRYIQDKLSNALVREDTGGCVNPFVVLKELEAGLRHHSLITSEEQRERYRELLVEVRREYENIIKTEVQRAIAADEDALARLCANYIDHVKAYTQGERVRNPYTGEYEEPNEQLMRSIEEKIDIPESRKDDFRREIMNYIGALALEGKKFTWRSNERLQRALEMKLFEDQKDTIKLASLVTAVVDEKTQEKIDIVKARLIRDYGYCEICASVVLNYVASIFARGDSERHR